RPDCLMRKIAASRIRSFAPGVGAVSIFDGMPEVAYVDQSLYTTATFSRALKVPMATFIPPNPAYEEAVRRILLAMPYVRWLGLSFQHIAPGQVDFVMPNRPEITF